MISFSEHVRAHIHYSQKVKILPIWKNKAFKQKSSFGTVRVCHFFPDLIPIP